MFGHDQNLFMQLDAAIHAGRNGWLSCAVLQRDAVHPHGLPEKLDMIPFAPHNPLDKVAVTSGADAIGDKPPLPSKLVDFIVFWTQQHYISPMYGAMRLHVDAQWKTLRGVDDEKTGRHLSENENQNRAATK